MTEELREGQWDPRRVLPALGKIGYSPTSAILDIVDNSVSYDATVVRIWLTTEQERREGPGRRRTLVTSVAIADDGVGMDEDGLDNALQLGSSGEDYRPDALSKFGMGLKSAASSLGRQLELVSRRSGGPIRKATLDHDVIEDAGRYVYALGDPTADDVDLLNGVAVEGSGTLVRITKIHQDNMPTPASILEDLRSRVGVVYYFRLLGSDERQAVQILLNDEPMAAADPLFEAEAETVGDLDETQWDGLDVRYIARATPIQLSDKEAVYATVTMTQLPHPPSVASAMETTQKATRERFMIGAGNYGFYIYRNGRLISWADRLGMVPQDQDLFSFRGRLEIGSDADDVLNLDVAKSRIKLSSIAEEQLRALLNEGAKKSRLAWQNAGRLISQRTGTTPHAEINEELDRAADLAEKDESIDEEAAPPQERERLRQRREGALERQPATEEERSRLEESGERVQYVSSLDHNQLWERAHDPTSGLIVRVNTAHRLFRDIVNAQMENAAFVKVFDVLLFALAHAEYDLVYKSGFPEQTVEGILAEYRERVGGGLSELLRGIDVSRLLAGE